MLHTRDLDLPDSAVPPISSDSAVAASRPPPGSDDVNIDHCVLGEAADADGRYMYLLDPLKRRILAAARFSDSGDCFELDHFTADQYGPALLLLLIQKARREGRQGVWAHPASSSDEAKSICARFQANPPAGASLLPVPAASGPDGSQRLCCIDEPLVPEIVARRNADRHFGRTVASRVRLNRLRLRDVQTYSRWHTGAGVLAMVRQSLARHETQRSGA